MAATYTVSGECNPWLAGMPDGSLASWGDAAPGQSPVKVSDTLVVPGSWLSIVASGAVSFSGFAVYQEPFQGPDGKQQPDGTCPHTAGVENGLADCIAPIDALMGVFLGPSQPNLTPAPARLDFSTPDSRDYAKLTPALKQVFFIGDGQTGAGLLQQVLVPVGATRLFLGGMDGCCWKYDWGSFAVEAGLAQDYANQPPVISSHPAARKVFVGDATRLVVAAHGEWPLTFQWRRGGVDLRGANTPSLILTNASLTMTGGYTVLVSNAHGAVTSALAQVTVTPRPSPGDWVQWEAAYGGNGHWYQAVAVPSGITWREADAHARADGGHLATVISADENEFLLSLVRSSQFFMADGSGPALGGYHPPGSAEPNTGWTWVAGEPWDLTFWDESQPDNGGGVESGLQYRSGRPSVGWSDVGIDSLGVAGYVAERENDPDRTYLRTQLAQVGVWSPSAGAAVQPLATSGTRALVTTSDSRVHLLDLSNASRPVWLGSWTPLFQPSSLALAMNTAYIASYELDFLSTVEIVDFTDPAHPVFKGYYDTPGYALEVAVVGGLAYVADDEAGLLVLDVSDPVRPRRIGGYDTQGHVRCVQVVNHYAYIADGAWLLILDINDPSAPDRVGLYHGASTIQALRVIGQRAYVAVGAGQLRILDVSDPGNIRPSGTYRTFGVQAMALGGKYAYLAKGSVGLEVVDVSDPKNMAWVSGTTTADSAQDVAAIGEHVIVAAGDAGSQVLEVQQFLYPPLSPPACSGGMLTLTWPPLDGVRLQKATRLISPTWEDVAGSEGTNTLSLPITDPAAFFRLVEP